MVLTVIFVYTTVVNIVERPEGIKIASFFIVTIIVTSLVSRVMRSTELRVQGIEADAIARALPAGGGRRAAAHHRQPS